MMSLQEQLDQDLIKALKAKQEVVVSVLRLLKSALKNKAIELGKEPSNEEINRVILSQIKQRRDAIEQYQKGNRPELAVKEQQEIEILQKYLPKQMTEEEISQIIQETIKKVHASGPQDMGKVMARLMPQVQGRADGTIVSQIVKEKLNK